MSEETKHNGLDCWCEECSKARKRKLLEAKVARLERELAEANDALATISLAILSKGTEETIADAEALRALAAWSAEESGRTVEFCCMDCEWQCWLGTGKDADVPIVGTGTTLADAIMDAISKAQA